jgi:glycosyltransferase involved in cell wall biosynthesis
VKVALVHEWLTNLAGSERVVLALSRLFPEAPVYTSVYRPERLPEEFRRLDVRATFLDRLPGAVPHQALLPILPFAFESLDLRDYDLVISSSHSCAKGVLTRSDALHVSYCHTPMRYAWDFYHDYQRSLPPAVRPLSAWMLHRMRIWDVAAASRVDEFIANSRNVAQRVAKWYRREAAVIHPPIRVSRFSISEPGGSYVLVSRLVPYKSVDVAIEAFNRLGLSLDIVGRGQEYGRLRRMAGPNIRFLGWLSDDEVARTLSRARAVVFPAEEDFGLVPLEAMACGRPVIALGRGGALETVVDGQTGVFFGDATPDALAGAVRRSEALTWDPQRIREHAAAFDETAFLARMQTYVDRLLAHRQGMSGAAAIEIPIRLAPESETWGAIRAVQAGEPR